MCSSNRKVVDIFSRKTSEDKEKEMAANDELINTPNASTYVGMLPEKETKEVREAIETIAKKRAYVNAMIGAFRKDYTEYTHLLASVLDHLEIDSIDLEKEDLIIAENGHVWYVPYTNKKETH